MALGYTVTLPVASAQQAGSKAETPRAKEAGTANEDKRLESAPVMPQPKSGEPSTPPGATSNDTESLEETASDIESRNADAATIGAGETLPPNAPEGPVGSSLDDEAAREPLSAGGSKREGTSQREAADGDEVDRVKYELEAIQLRGNTRTRTTVVLRYLPFRVGRVLDVDDAEFTLARYRLLGTGFFRDVQFSLRKGSRRGRVVLVVDLEERNTVVLNGIWFGLSADSNGRGQQRPLTAYGGVEIAETNVAGSGLSLGGALGVAQNQYAWRLRFTDPGFLGSPWMITGNLLHNHAIDFFGTGRVGFQATPTAPESINVTHAVLPYSRFGGSLGFGRDISVSSQIWFHYRLETIEAQVPVHAWQDGRGQKEPIQFDIQNGRSVFSAIRVNFQSDTRDHPFLPTRGWFVGTWGELGLAPFGSDYDYQRFDISASSWWKVKGTEHVFRLQGFAGAMSGKVPFFEQYYVGDFCDFLPARMLGLNIDSRPAADFFGTSIRSVRYGHYAAEIAGEYRVPIFRGHRSVFGIDVFLRAGLWGLANHRDLKDPGTAYRGLQRLPIDFTANAGFRIDTSAGGFVFSFSNVLGFFPVRGGS